VIRDGHHNYNVIPRAKSTEYVWPDLILQVTNGKEVELDPDQDLTYEEFYSFYGVSKFYGSLKNRKYERAAKLLNSQTTLDYEEHIKKHSQFRFPNCQKEVSLEPYSDLLKAPNAAWCHKDAYKFLGCDKKD
jgi:hypothetical protein